MRWPIDFNQQLCLVTDEVGNETADRNLPAELQTVQLTIAKSLPEFLLGGNGIRAQISRIAECPGMKSMMRIRRHL
jgi:hypothetical protein